MGPIWGRQDSVGPHVGPMNWLATSWATHRPGALLVYLDEHTWHVKGFSIRDIDIVSTVHYYQKLGVLCNIWCPSETHVQLKSREISHNICFSCPSILEFCTEHGIYIAVLCAKIWSRSNHCNRCYIRTRFHEIWVQYEFSTAVLYCTASHIRSNSTEKPSFNSFRKSQVLIDTKYRIGHNGCYYTGHINNTFSWTSKYN